MCSITHIINKTCYRSVTLFSRMSSMKDKYLSDNTSRYQSFTEVKCDKRVTNGPGYVTFMALGMRYKYPSNNKSRYLFFMDDGQGYLFLPVGTHVSCTVWMIRIFHRDTYLSHEWYVSFMDTWVSCTKTAVIRSPELGQSHPCTYVLACIGQAEMASCSFCRWASV